MTRKILVTGVSGMLGKDVAKIFLADKKYKVFGISRHQPEALHGLNFVKLNLLDLTKLAKILKKISPGVIIHCAAIVDVDRCAKNHQVAKTIHVKVSKILAKGSKRSTKLIYISTDSVFDGIKGNYQESDKARPLNYYAKTKQQGEEAVLKGHVNSLVIRTNIFGFHDTPGASLAEWGLDNLFKKQPINGFVDVYFNPVYTKQLAKTIKEIVDKRIFLTGILNIGSNKFLNKYNFLIKMAEIFHQDKKLIKKTKITNSRLSTIRPKNTTLSTNKLEKVLKEKISFASGLKEFKEDFLKHKVKK